MPVRQINPGELGHFGLDEQNHLYWDGQPVQTGIGLTRAQAFWAIIAAIATVANATANVWSTFFKAPSPAQQVGTPTTSPAAPSAPKQPHQ
jgi:hypothetical protein